MAIILFVGYLGVILYNLYQKEPSRQIPILRLLLIGILVQLGWEAGLLLGGIRSAGFDTLEAKLLPLLVNSLLETNLGMPYVFCIYIAYSRRFTEQLHRRKNKLSFTERIAELNRKSHKN